MIAELADDVIVMYAGKVVETLRRRGAFAEPQHPYTIGLLGSIPRLDLAQARLSAIEGVVPDPCCLPAGMPLPSPLSVCSRQMPRRNPALIKVSENHEAACWRAPL